jgi:hypothetical protein
MPVLETRAFTPPPEQPRHRGSENCRALNLRSQLSNRSGASNKKQALPWGTVAKQPKHPKYEAGNKGVQLKISNKMSFRTDIDDMPLIANRLIAAFAGKDILAS